MKFSVPEMSCGHCVATIKDSIGKVDPAAVVGPDLEARTVTVETSHGDAAIVAALKDAGYDAQRI